jgi:hypothetical protein
VAHFGRQACVFKITDPDLRGARQLLSQRVQFSDLLIILQGITRAFDFYKFARLIRGIPKEQVWKAGTPFSIVFAKQFAYDRQGFPGNTLADG